MNNPPKAKILVVEDDVGLCEAITTRLEHQGFEAVATGHALEALKQLHDHDDFDAIWLDFNILDFDGLEFMKRYNQQFEASKRVPVVIVSNTGDEDKIEEALRLGAKKYIIKAEIRLDDVVDQMLKIIE